MRRGLVALFSLSLAVAGSQVAHAAAYRLVTPDREARAHLLAETGHSYLRLAPLGLALLTVVAALALLTEARAGRRHWAASRARLWTFAGVAPVTFACQETFERLLHDGAVPWALATERTFLVGLALQVPFALAAYGLARALLRTAHALGRLLGVAAAPGRVTLPHWPATPYALAHGRAHLLVRAPRGPPAPSL